MQDLLSPLPQPDSKTTAVIMAIVSDQSGIPLDELRFKSIRPIANDSTKTAATIMAIVSDQSGIPLNQLRFKSIKPLI